MQCIPAKKVRFTRWNELKAACQSRRYHNVHGATNNDAPLQAPSASVAQYNRTVLDTYKVAVSTDKLGQWEWPPDLTRRRVPKGAMITKLDDGVGAVHAALGKAGMLPNAIIAFCSGTL